MRPGKLFKFKGAATAWPTTRERDSVGRVVSPNTLFLVISTKPVNLENVVNYYDLHAPWLVLIGEKPELIDILNRTVLDVTPFINEKGEPYILDYFLE